MVSARPRKTPHKPISIMANFFEFVFFFILSETNNKPSNPKLEACINGEIEKRVNFMNLLETKYCAAIINDQAKPFRIIDIEISIDDGLTRNNNAQKKGILLNRKRLQINKIVKEIILSPISGSPNVEVKKIII